MATCWITEVSHMAYMTGGERVQAIMMPPVAEQSFAFSTATQSSAFAATTKAVRIMTDANAHVAVGANPTATAANLPLTGRVAEYIGVTPGQKLSVIVGA